MKAGRWIMLVAGTLLALAGFAVLAGGGVLGIGYAVGRDADGWFNSPHETLRTDSYAVTSEPLVVAGTDDLPAFLDPEDFGRFRLEVVSGKDADVFVGIAPEARVAAYLRGVGHAEVTDIDVSPFRGDDDRTGTRYRPVDGGPPASEPASQDFWTASSSGPGRQRITWDVEDGRWSVVVMNADGSPGVVADVRAGGRFDIVGPLAIGLVVGGIVLLAIGIPLLIAGAVALSRRDHHEPGASTPPAAPTAPAPVAATSATNTPPVAPPPLAAAARPGHAPYPARLEGVLDEPLSRWLWLVKWILAIPHAIVLVFLWIAFVVLTIVAGVAILFTGRYPRGIFDFNVGVLRWTWRVGFYAYSALGTDRYPPFTLARTDDPADFDVDYPEHLSRGLVLVKWWLLALPHLLIVAVFGGGWAIGLGRIGDNLFDGRRDFFLQGGGGLIGLLVVIAGVILLFTRRYPEGLFDAVMGMNRWVYRVTAYVALMTDAYPPFRFDVGPRDPADTAGLVEPPHG